MSCDCNKGPSEYTDRQARVPRVNLPKRCEVNGILFGTITVPVNLGTDEKGQAYAPRDGLYYNKLVRYEANGAVVLYDSRGVYTYLAKEVGVTVESVNGKTGVVVLKISDLENDSGYQTAEEVAALISAAAPSIISDADYDNLWEEE